MFFVLLLYWDLFFLFLLLPNHEYVYSCSPFCKLLIAYLVTWFVIVRRHGVNRASFLFSIFCKLSVYQVVSLRYMVFKRNYMTGPCSYA